MDFVHDRLVTGRRFKCLTMTDPCSKEVPVIEVDVSIYSGPLRGRRSTNLVPLNTRSKPKHARQRMMGITGSM